MGTPWLNIKSKPTHTGTEGWANFLPFLLRGDSINTMLSIKIPTWWYSYYFTAFFSLQTGLKQVIGPQHPQRFWNYWRLKAFLDRIQEALMKQDQTSQTADERSAHVQTFTPPLPLWISPILGGWLQPFTSAQTRRHARTHPHRTCKSAKYVQNKRRKEVKFERNKE